MLHTIYQKQVEAWKERFLMDFGLGIINWNTEDPDYKELLSSRHKDTIELIEAEIERKKGLRLTPANKGYDGNNLESACDFYGIAAENWAEIIRYEDGFNLAIDEDIAYLEEQIKLIKND